MPKKKTERLDEVKPKTSYYCYYNDKSSDHLNRLNSLLSNQNYRRERLLSRHEKVSGSGIIYSDTFHTGTTKSWLSDSKRCRHQQPNRYPQLVEVPAEDIAYEYDHDYIKHPPSKLGNINTVLQFTSRSCGTYSYGNNYNCNLKLTGICNPALMVTIKYRDNWTEPKVKDRLITHKSTEIDPYDANSQVVRYGKVIRSKDGKYFALSSQGAFFVLEETDGDRIVITGKCGTRAVPCSLSAAKFYREYLIESRGEILLVFLMFKETTWGLADGVEVFRFDNDTLKLVKVDRIKGRALFLEDDCCIWVDSRELGCKSDCVYFTGGSGDGWWMYDMKTGSISDKCVDIPGIEEELKSS